MRKHLSGFGTHRYVLAFAITAIFALTGTRSWALGNSDGGGGTGVVLNGKLTVLDLVEANVDSQTDFPTVTPNPIIVKLLQKNFNAPSSFKSSIVNALAMKLTEIDQSIYPLGTFMAYGFSGYEIRPVSYPLTASEDIDSSVGLPKVQLAERKENVISISMDNWTKLDTVNQVALLTHEVVYAFQPSAGGHNPESTINQILQTSAKARFFNGYFYGPDWKNKIQTRLAREMATASDRVSSFNYLYDLVSKSVGSKSHIIDFKDGNPVFDALEIRADKNQRPLSIGVLRAGTTTSAIARMCHVIVKYFSEGGGLEEEYEDNVEFLSSQVAASDGDKMTITFDNFWLATNQSNSLYARYQDQATCVKEIKAAKSNLGH